MSHKLRKAGKIILICLSSIIALLLILCIVIWVNSPGNLQPLKDEHGKTIEGAITEKGRIEINGIQQGYFIRSEHPDNPVILYLHGGPGSPELSFIEPFEKAERLEKYFTVCYWEQRGAGITFLKDTDPATTTVPQFIEDTRVMTEYLMKRFGKKKIYLMGHSWGSYLGIKVIEKYPEYYLAYIGIGQVTHQLLSEQIAYDYMLKHARETGDHKAIKALGEFNRDAPDFPSISYIMGPRSNYMNKYGIGIMHENVLMAKIVWDVFMFKGYTFSEKMRYPQGSMFSLHNVFHYVTADNLFESSTVFSVPVYIIHGVYDYQVSHELAGKWINIIEAPEKEFYSFKNSAHSPNTEEPERFVSIVRSIAKRNQ